MNRNDLEFAVKLLEISGNPQSNTLKTMNRDLNRFVKKEQLKIKVLIWAFPVIIIAIFVLMAWGYLNSSIGILILSLISTSLPFFVSDKKVDVECMSESSKKSLQILHWLYINYQNEPAFHLIMDSLIQKDDNDWELLIRASSAGRGATLYLAGEMINHEARKYLGDGV